VTVPAGPDPAPDSNGAVILAVDTTSEHGSLALLASGELLEEIRVHSPEGFGHRIFQEIAALLARHGIRAGDIACFAAAAGPGSFTGVRVGLAAIKGLAEATGRPAVAVSNLETLATFGAAPNRAVLIEARRGQIYGAVYDSAGRLVVPESVEKFATWLETLPAGLLSAGIEFVTSGFTPLLAGTRFERAPVTLAPPALAAAVARIACERWRRGEAQDPASLDANYVRRSDAELFWKDEP